MLRNEERSAKELAKYSKYSIQLSSQGKDKVLFAQRQYMARKLTEEYEKWTLTVKKIFLCTSEKTVNTELDTGGAINVRKQTYVNKPNYFSLYRYAEIHQRSTKAWREIKVLSSV